MLRVANFSLELQVQIMRYRKISLDSERMCLHCRDSVLFLSKFGKTIYWESISVFVFLFRNRKSKYCLNHDHVKKRSSILPLS